MNYRTEEDQFGKMKIPAERMWGIQTQRSLENFPIGNEKMPEEIIQAYAFIKKAAARANVEVGKLDSEKGHAIQAACDEILKQEHQEEFPLSLWQTGSGTQTNMNVNEVIANLIHQEEDAIRIHPNDEVNMGQSSNDTFPTAIHLAGVLKIKQELLPSLEETEELLSKLQKKYIETIKLGRTHLQDATPITFGQEVSAWKKIIQENKQRIEASLPYLYELPLGGTAVGTGLNTHPDFADLAISYLSDWTSIPFRQSDNHFHGLSSKDGLVHVHHTLQNLAIHLMKIGNDIRWLASGPRAGFGEISLPANEAGSSIMPGKVNPTQIEALTMVCVQVIGNDTTISIAASQGNFQLNVYMPVMAHNLLQSIQLLTDALTSFNKRTLKGLEANEDIMASYVEESLALVTSLAPQIGYEKASLIVQKAEEENLSLREAAKELQIVDMDDFDQFTDPKHMI